MAEEKQKEKALPLSEEIRALLRGANFAHLATLMPDGTPHVDPVWVDVEDDNVLVCSGTSSLKSRNAKRDARIGLSIIDMDNPYKEAQLRGRVVEQRPDPSFTMIDRLAHKYTGKPFPFRDRPAERIVLVIAAERARYLALPFVHAPAQGADMAGDEETIRQTFLNYVQSFQALQARAALPYFQLPCFFISDQGVRVLADNIELEGFLSQLMERLKARGFARSEIADMKLNRMSEQLALVSVWRIRYQTDGSELEHLGETYTFRKIDREWKIAAAMPHDPGAVLTLA